MGARPLTVAQAAALGALHGPAELLPVSSSAHVGLVSHLLGWPYGALDGPTRKAFEVALHAGSLPAALAVTPRPRLAFAVLAAAPAAVAGVLAQGPVERRLGTPRGTAAGLVAGSAVLLAAEALARRRAAARPSSSARGSDAVAIGLAQAAALVPGLSRTGTAYAAARARGFAPDAALALSREAGLPVVAGAVALKARDLVRDGLPPGLRAPFCAGAGAALAAGVAALPLARRPHVRACAAERLALAALVLRP